MRIAGGHNGRVDDGATTLIHSLREALARATGRAVALIETHISWVLLDGEHAWKIKKPLALGFLDYHDLAARRRLSEAEWTLNRRLAPSVYLGVVPITGTPEAPVIDGEGEPIEVALKMRQFPQGALLSSRVAAGSVTADVVDALAQRLAAFHRAAPHAAAPSGFGAPAAVDASVAQTVARLGAFFPDAALQPLHAAWRAAFARVAALAEARRAAGFVREGHGDLHLDNLVVLDDGPTAFDCIEFDAALRWVDVQADIAFAVMDFIARGRRDLAFRFLAGWLDVLGDHAGLPLLRPWVAARALVRALVTAMRGPREGDATPSPQRYLAVAREALEPAPRLLATTGLSGSGKSRLAAQLVEEVGAIRVRADVERKRLFGLDALADSHAAVPGGIYGPEATRRTYAVLQGAAAAALDGGFPTIVDAACLQRAERDGFAAMAEAKGVPFLLLHTTAPEAVLRERVRARRQRGDDPSEADEAVLERQLAFQQPPADDESAHTLTLDTSQPVDVARVSSQWQAGRYAGRPADR